jgi:xanthine/CO dehydrogenase XdhC/CoxF family maturation factor
MREHFDLIEAYAGRRDQGDALLLATVVGVRGSAYRRPGARMLLGGGRWLAGAVSGGCLESDVAKKASWRTENGPALVTYDATLDDDDVTWGFGLGCNGVVEVLLERLTDSTCPLRTLERCVRERKPVAIGTVLSAPALGQRTCAVEGEAAETTITDPSLHEAMSMAIQRLRGRAGAHHAELRGHSVMIEIIEPPAPFVVFGAGYDVVPLIHAAKLVGWHTTVVDTGARPGTAARFAHADAVVALDAARAHEIVTPSSVAVIMTHNIETDQALLGALVGSPARYIGVLGPKARSERMLAELSVPDEHRQRIHAPVGLDIGAEGADEIAIAIVAEITAAMNERSGSMLRLRDAPLHVARV